MSRPHDPFEALEQLVACRQRSDSKRYDQAYLAANRAWERALVPAVGVKFAFEAQCAACGSSQHLNVDWRFSAPQDGEHLPNWREHLACPGCLLNNRCRAVVHRLANLVSRHPPTRLYVTEQTTPLYRWLHEHHENVVGSEFLTDDTESGRSNAAGIRHEDLTQLSFESGSCDFVLSFDVLEHVPDTARALAECHRVLKPGGALLMTAPFDATRNDNLVRARKLTNGSIEHLEPPEYHSDPLSDEGCLAYYVFGWQLLAQLRRAGFRDAEVLRYWSARFGYLGDNSMMLARR